MELLEPFWSGALTHGTAREALALLEALGHSDLARLTLPVMARCGVEERRARGWLAARGRETVGQVLTVADPDFPAFLRDVPGAPAVLLMQGDRSCLAQRRVAVVGTRACTGYGAAVARHLGSALATRGVVVVSGLARGIDGHAHRGTLGKGRSLAVLGHGLAHTSPTSHVHLRSELVEHGGLVVSTWPDEAPPARYTFPRRNTWIAALSQAVVVVEAPERSGALITAAAAMDLGIPVWAVPDALGRPASAGSLGLIRDGANALLDVEAFADQEAGSGAARTASWLRDLFAGASLDEVARSRGVSLLQLLRELSGMEMRDEVVLLGGQRVVPGRRSKA